MRCICASGAHHSISIIVLLYVEYWNIIIWRSIIYIHFTLSTYQYKLPYNEGAIYDDSHYHQNKISCMSRIEGLILRNMETFSVREGKIMHPCTKDKQPSLQTLKVSITTRSSDTIQCFSPSEVLVRCLVLYCQYIYPLTQGPEHVCKSVNDTSSIPNTNSRVPEACTYNNSVLKHEHPSLYYHLLYGFFTYTVNIFSTVLCCRIIYFSLTQSSHCWP